jgi:hypothetical protein
MKSFVTIITLAATILTVRAEKDQGSTLTIGSSGILSGSVTFNGSVVISGPGSSDPPPVNYPLISSGRRGKVRYFNGPAFSWWIGGSTDLDLNVDGSTDFTFAGESSTAPAIILGISSLRFDLHCMGSNQVLTTSSSIGAMPCARIAAA